MYSLKESWTLMHGSLPFEGWDGLMYCVQANGHMALQTNKTNGFISAYTFTLVREGWLTLLYNGRELKLCPNDLYIYSPGMEITVLETSDDYKGLCLLVDEHLTLETDTVRDMVRVAYWPIVRLHEPRIALPQDMAIRLGNRIRGDNGGKGNGQIACEPEIADADQRGNDEKDEESGERFQLLFLLIR